MRPLPGTIRALMAQEAQSDDRLGGLGPVTTVLTLINLVIAVGVLWGHLDSIFPGWSDPVADRARDIDDLFRFMLVFGLAICVYITGYVLYFVWLYRRRPGEPLTAIGTQIHENPRLEFWWTVVPSLLLVLLTAMSIVEWYKIQFGTGAAALTMEVIGHQFYFEFRYPGLPGSIYSKSEPMHLPVGKSVRVLVTSADVLHQFWVPEIRLKAATVPGLVQNLNFTPLKEGQYDIACSEYCGVDHSVMQAKLIIESPDAFKQWMATEKTKMAGGGKPVSLAGGTADAGKAIFTAKCSACHSTGPYDEKKVGPGLGNLMHDSAHPTLLSGKAPTPENIADVLQNGITAQPVSMPNAQANALSDKDIANLVAYLVSLK